jgi:hypothetical protein
MKVVAKLAVIAVFAVAFSGAGLAQSFDHKVRAEVPFNFYASNKMLPAGSYTFALDKSNQTVLILQNDRTLGALLLGSASDSSKPERTALVFRSNGDGVYALEKLQGPDFAVAFDAKTTLSRIAQDRSDDTTQTLVAQLLK